LYFREAGRVAQLAQAEAEAEAEAQRLEMGMAKRRSDVREADAGHLPPALDFGESGGH
jgi:hypothetical protein